MAKPHKTSKRNPTDPSHYQPSEDLLAYLHAAEQSYANGNFQHAIEIYRKILALDKHFLIPLKKMALCELQVNAPQNAIKLLVKYLKHGIKDPEACAYLAQAYLSVGQTGKAKQSIGTALKLAQTADLHFLAATVEEHLNAPEKAAAQYEQGLALAPDHLSASLALGILHKNLGNFNKAIKLFEKTLASEPDNTSALANLGNVYHAIGLYERAIDYYNHALQLKRDADIAYNLGLSLQQISKLDESLSAFSLAVELKPEHLDAQFQIAESLSEQGNFDDARETLDSIISASPDYSMVWYAKSQYKKFEQENTEVEKKLLELCKPSKDSGDTSLAHFGLGKIYDDTQRYDIAFDHFVIGNKQKAKFSQRATEQQLAQLTTSLDMLDDQEWNLVQTQTTHPSPIFIVGMPRSGTTLLERSISRASDIAACGEVDYFGPALFRITNKLGEFSPEETLPTTPASLLNSLQDNYLKRITSLVKTPNYFIDKTPDNFRFVGTLEQLFPNAKFIHCQRNPLDTCLSIFFQNFENLAYSYDLNSIAKYYLNYCKIIDAQRERLSSKNKWLDVVYEDYVTNETAVTGSIAAFLGVKIDTAVSNAAKPELPIRTMSKWQARQAIHQGSVGRWEHYKERLTSLRNALSSVL